MLLVLVPLAALTLGFLHVAVAFNREHVEGAATWRARSLAEAGLDEAVFALRQGGDGSVGTMSDPVYFGGGLLWVEVESVGNALLLLRSCAMYEEARTTLERLVFRNDQGLFAATIFSSQPLVLSSNVFVDSYDSTLGTYASQVSGGYAGDGAIVESNEDVVVESSVEVYGDVHPGMDSTLEVPGSSEVTGSMQPMAEPRVIPPVTVPAITSSGDLTATGTQVLAPGDHAFGALAVDVGATLTITGPARVVIDAFEMRSNCELVLDSASGPIELYVSGALVQSSNSTITTTSPSAIDARLNLVGDETQVVDLRSNGAFHGVVVAPEATVNVSSNFEIFGAITANAISLASNARIHYDENLTEYATDVEFVRSAWTVAEFPYPALRADRSDPFRLLDVDRRDLRSPAQAHGGG